MTVGVAIVVVAVMYFIDKHNLWRRFAICVGILVVVALLGLGWFWGWTTYREARDKKALAEFNKKWAAEVPACNARNIKTYFDVAVQSASKASPPPGYELVQEMPQSTMEEIKKGCNADPYTYVWNAQLRFGETEECLDGTNDPCMLKSDGHGSRSAECATEARDQSTADRSRCNSLSAARARSQS
jgi:hypothetical protein